MVVLANSEAANSSRLGQRVMRRALGIAEPVVKALPLEPKELARHEGTYDLGPLQLRIFAEDGRLRAQVTNQSAFDILYQGEHTFVSDAKLDVGHRLVFKVEGERASGLTVFQGGIVMPAPRIE